MMRMRMEHPIRSVLAMVRTTSTEKFFPFEKIEAYHPFRRGKTDE